MKWSIRDLLSSRQEKLSWGLTFHWGGGELILAAILIFGILSLGSGMFGKWFSAARDIGLLPVTLHSLGEADYSVDEFLRSVPVIGLDIIKDLLGINEPPETGGAAGIALITPGSSTPTPTSPFRGFLPETATATGENPDSATATHNPPATATSSLGRTATPTPLWTAQATPSPTWTYSPPTHPCHLQPLGLTLPAHHCLLKCRRRQLHQSRRHIHHYQRPRILHSQAQLRHQKVLPHQNQHGI